MSNELFIKLLGHEKTKEVPLAYIIVIFSAIQEILEKDRLEDQMMDIE